jgi:hypothetical protein
MPTPYLPLNFNVTSSVSVQNVADETGTIATYVWLRSGLVSQKGMQFRMGSTESPDVVVKLTSTSIIPALTAALSSALQNSSAAGVWGA